MDRKALALPEIGLIAGTRAALGAGVGLLVADRLDADQRRAVGWTLLLVGALSTIPIALQLFREESVPTGKRLSARGNDYVGRDGESTVRESRFQRRR